MSTAILSRHSSSPLPPRLATRDGSLALVGQARQWVSPNDGFLQLLLSYEQQMSDCELCALERRTQWLDDSDPRFVVLECDQCGLPMAVARRHGLLADAEMVASMESALLNATAKQPPGCNGNDAGTCQGGEKSNAGGGQYFIDKRQRSIHNHLHWHARPKEGAPWLLHQYEQMKVVARDKLVKTGSSNNTSKL
jgi:hypothetical protein